MAELWLMRALVIIRRAPFVEAMRMIDLLRRMEATPTVVLMGRGIDALTGLVESGEKPNALGVTMDGAQRIEGYELTQLISSAQRVLVF